ncbi:MAG: NAD(P)H-dependent oxidoreductase [Candidatus Pacebacteria bacterium]|nr:NAD(P)H-dependent oxidoreductase [Candidatus Paceibacterota bacterium]
MDKLKVKVIIGSTREGRFGDKPAAWIAELAKERADMDIEILDLRDYPIPFFDQQETPSYKTKPYNEPNVVKLTAKIAEADAYIITVAEYNHGYTAVLKNAMDWVYQEWNNKPVAFVAYGSAGGARAIEQLREVAIELQLAPIRNAVHMTYDAVIAIGQGTAPAQAFAPYVDRAKALLEQLAWWGNALKAARIKA